MSFKLTSPQDAVLEIARVFLNEEAAVIEVKEDKCFGTDGYWRLGGVTLDGDSSSLESITRSLRHGAYEWSVRPYKEALDDLSLLLQIGDLSPAKNKDQHERTVARLDRIMDSVATTAVRLGLVFPIFDSQSAEDMPFRQGTTVIADTSGVIQGGLDFVSSFLHPAARIKIPAVVHMEVVNQADNFLKRRRALKTNGSALLLDHMISQAGQRALLRLELRADTEVERSLLVGDPLRNAFQRDTDSEWNDLQLSVPLRSYCDRLILEAARQHQSQSNPGHKLQLLTCDQGFARMALAEGVTPLYFRAVSGQAFFGHTHTGTRFHPFRPGLHHVALQDVLWELAVAFGSVRVTSNDGARWVEVAAFGEELTWSPVHSHNDLLWIRDTGLPPLPAKPAPSAPQALAVPQNTAKTAVSTPRKPAAAKITKAAGPTPTAFYRFNPERMLNLVVKLSEEGRLPDARAQAISEARDDRGFSEFRRFLLGGELAIHKDETWEPTEAGMALGADIRELDHEKIVEGLSRVPSVKLFFQYLADAPISMPIDFKLPDRAETTYKALAEICLLAAPIPTEGYYPTPTKVSPREFAAIAVERFREMETEDGWVSVGSWLEALVRRDGIHPERSRRYLDEAQASGMINRSTEGSTTDTRHDQHVVRVLRIRPGAVTIDLVHLYRGDFLIPNKSSSSLRLGAV